MLRGSLLAAVLLALAIGASASNAAFHGRNGRIAFVHDGRIYTMTAHGTERQETRLLLFRAHDGAVLVTPIQGLIRAFDEDLTPFNKAGSGEGRHSTNDDFLEKGGVHYAFKST
jgi:hypothetical protein